MEVKVDGYVINKKVKELLIKQYGFLEDGAESIAHDVEKILEDNQED